MKQLTVLLLVVCAFYMINESDAWWFAGRGYYYGWRRPIYYPYNRGYYPYFYSGYWKRSLEGSQKLECSYFEEKGILSCTGLGNIVDCETVRVFDSSITQPFKFYAIGARSQGDVQANVSRVYYDLYPEMLEKKGWLNSTFIDAVLSKSYTYSLYFSQDFSFSGFRVKDLECFRNLTSLFDRIESNETISVQLAADRKEEIRIIGGILLS